MKYDPEADIVSDEDLAMREEEASEPTKAPNPPSRTKSWYEKFFEILQSRKVESVDLDFVRANITSDPKDAAKFIRGLRFLGLVDSQGRSTPAMLKLRLTGDEFNTNLQATVQTAYKKVFDTIVVETAKNENVVNFFIESYGFSGSAAKDAVALFVYFAIKSGVSVSESLTSILNSQASVMSKKTAVSKPARERIGEHKELDLQKSAELEELRIGQVRIWLPKGDAKAAESAKNLIDLYLKTLT